VLTKKQNYSFVSYAYLTLIEQLRNKYFKFSAIFVTFSLLLSNKLLSLKWWPGFKNCVNKKQKAGNLLYSLLCRESTSNLILDIVEYFGSILYLKNIMLDILEYYDNFLVTILDNYCGSRGDSFTNNGLEQTFGNAVGDVSGWRFKNNWRGSDWCSLNCQIFSSGSRVQVLNRLVSCLM